MKLRATLTIAFLLLAFGSISPAAQADACVGISVMSCLDADDCPIEGAGTEEVCDYAGTCSGASTWVVTLTVIEGTIEGIGKISCDGEVQDECGLAASAPFNDECTLHGAQSGPAYCHWELTYATSGSEGNVHCEDPYNPLNFLTYHVNYP